MKKEVRGIAGESKADTAARDTAARDTAAAVTLAAASFAATGASASLPTAPASDPASGLQSPASTPAKRVYSAEEKRVCSIEAMKRGEECEACQ